MAVSPGSAPAIPDVDGGVVLGTVPGGGPVRVPFFTAARGTRCAVIGDRSIAVLMAKRALDAGARVQVVTSEPDDWFRLRGHAGLSPECLVVADPGTAPPPDGTGRSPWMIMDDTGILTGDPDGVGARIPRVSNPWQAFCAVSSARNVAVAALRGLDAIVLFRSSPFCRAVAAVALQLPDPAMRSPCTGYPATLLPWPAPDSQARTDSVRRSRVRSLRRARAADLAQPGLLAQAADAGQFIRAERHWPEEQVA